MVLMNRNQKNAYEIQLEIENGRAKRISGSTYTSETPYQPYLWQNTGEAKPYIESEIAFKRNKQTVTVSVPAMSYTFMVLN